MTPAKLAQQAIRVNLTARDISIIRESLRYTILRFEDYRGYPSREFQLQQIADVKAVIAKLPGSRRKRGKCGARPLVPTPTTKRHEMP